MAAEGKCERQMTYGELCRAIEEGRLPYTIRDGHYELRASDARRLEGLGHTCPALPHPTEIPVELLDGLDHGQLHYSA